MLTEEQLQAQLEEALRLWRAGLHTEARALYAATLVVCGGRYTSSCAAAFFRQARRGMTFVQLRGYDDV